MTLPVGESAAVGAAIIWAFTSLIFTEVGRLVSPLAANTFKLVLAGALLSLVLWVTGGVPWVTGVARGDLLLLGASGLFGLTIGDSLLFIGFQALGARRGNLVFALAPVLGAVGGRLLLGERLGLPAIGGMAAAIGGVAFVVSERRGIVRRGHRLLTLGATVDGAGGHPLEGRTMLGVLVTLGAALGQASGALLARPALERVPALEATQIRVVASLLGMLVVGAAGGRLGDWTRGIVRRRLVASLTLASISGSFVGLWLMTVALDHTSTGIALTLLATPPIWLLPLGAWLQGDHPTRREVAGLVVALAGVALLFVRGA